MSSSHHQIFYLGCNVAKGCFFLCQDEITSMILKPSEMLNCLPLSVSNTDGPMGQSTVESPQGVIWELARHPPSCPVSANPVHTVVPRIASHSAQMTPDKRHRVQLRSRDHGHHPCQSNQQWDNSTKVTYSTMRDWLVATHWWTSQWMQWASIKHDEVGRWVTGILLGLHTVGSRGVHLADSTGLPQPASITDGHILNQLAPPLQGSHLIEIWPFNIGIGSSPGYTTGTHNHISIWGYTPKGTRV